MKEEVVIMKSDAAPGRGRPRMRSWGLGTVVALALSGASPALADTATGNQNPDLTVSVSLVSQGVAGPEQATAGDTVSGYLALDNNSREFSLEEVNVVPTLRIPSGESFNASTTIELFPGQTIKVPFAFTVPAFLPVGLYALTLEAIEVDDPGQPPSSATATITLY